MAETENKEEKQFLVKVIRRKRSRLEQRQLHFLLITGNLSWPQFACCVFLVFFLYNAAEGAKR